jgi:hypothetical protein
LEEETFRLLFGHRAVVRAVFGAPSRSVPSRKQGNDVVEEVRRGTEVASLVEVIQHAREAEVWRTARRGDFFRIQRKTSCVSRLDGLPTDLRDVEPDPQAVQLASDVR